MYVIHISQWMWMNKWMIQNSNSKLHPDSVQKKNDADFFLNARAFFCNNLFPFSTKNYVNQIFFFINERIPLNYIALTLSRSLTINCWLSWFSSFANLISFKLPTNTHRIWHSSLYIQCVGVDDQSSLA